MNSNAVTVKTAAELLLMSGKSVLLAGAPGTGKTLLAFKLAREFTAMDPLVIVGRGDITAKELLYSYEPSDSGFRITLGGLALSVLASWARLMLGLPPRWLLLDEVNRMNAETVLGNLFTALDLVHRQHVEIVPRWLVEHLLHDDLLLEEVANIAGLSKDEVRSALKAALEKAKELSGLPLPYWWRILATMNLVDRSHLFRLGFAFLRRFPVVLVPGIGGRLNPKLNYDTLREAEKALRSSSRQVYNNIVAAFTAEPCHKIASNELLLKSDICLLDRPIYILDLDQKLVEDAVAEFEPVIRLASIIIAKFSEVGMDVGSAIISDICRLIIIIAKHYKELHGDTSEAGADIVNLVADIVIGSLILPQLGAIAPAIKSELLFGGEAQRARKVKEIFDLILGNKREGVEGVLGEESMSARYVEALSLEIPLQQL